MKAWLPLVGLLLGGCAAWSSLVRPDVHALARADALVAQGEWAQALGAYEEVLRRRPDGAHAERARRSRDTVIAVVTAREEQAGLEAELARLRLALGAREADLARLGREAVAREAEIARLSRELAARQSELARIRDDLTTRQGDLLRVSAEADRLRSVLEDLKRLELRLERPR